MSIESGRLSISERLQNYIILPWFMRIASLTIVILGIIADIYDVRDNEHWFDRSGAVLIMFALCCAAARERLWEPVKLVHADIRTIEVMGPYLPDAYLTSDQKSKFKDKIEAINLETAKLRKDVSQTAKKYHRTELVIATVGTFIWGFGDVLIALAS